MKEESEEVHEVKGRGNAGEREREREREREQVTLSKKRLPTDADNVCLGKIFQQRILNV